MPFVIDASVAACWLLLDETHAVAAAAFERIAGDPAIVPSLWRFEMRNLLVVSERRGRIDSDKTTRALELLRVLPLSIDADEDETVLTALARAHRLTVYDAAYLELALRKRAPLATLDSALASAAVAEGVALVG